MRKFLLDIRKDFLILSNFHLVEILSEPNSLTIVASKKNTQNEQLCAHFEYFFLITRIRNFQCDISKKIQSVVKILLSLDFNVLLKKILIFSESFIIWGSRSHIFGSKYAIVYNGHNEQSEAATRSCSVKKAFLNISQKSQENTCTRMPTTLLKKRL